MNVMRILTIGTRRRAAFTLVELLVVVSIIAVLAALLLPALGKSKKKTKVVVCMNNQRNITQAASMYAMENDGFLPRRGPNSVAKQYPNIVGSTFLTQMDDFLTDRSLYYCPDGAVRSTERPIHHALFGGSLEYAYYSGLAVFLTTAPKQPDRLSDTEDQYGGSTVLFGDVNRWLPYPTTPIHTNHAAQGRDPFVSPAAGFTYYVGYPSGVNVAYIDSHVEWLPTTSWQLSRSYRSAGSDRSYFW